jgi:hypothetical protein
MKHSFLFALTVVACAAQAGAPMTTEDADVLAASECEWESAYERVKAGGESAKAFATGVGCHAFAGTQVGLGYARLTAQGLTVTGLSLSGKTALVARPEGGFGLTLAWGFEGYKVPGRSGYKHDVTTANFVATQGFGAISLHANLGWTRSKPDHETLRAWALGVEHALNEHIDLLAETYGEQKSKSSVGLGLRYKPDKQWALGFMGFQDRDTPKAKGFLLSAKLGF